MIFDDLSVFNSAFSHIGPISPDELKLATEAVPKYYGLVNVSENAPMRGQDMSL